MYGYVNASVEHAKGYIPWWRIANYIGVSEMTLRRWRQKALSPEHEGMILSAIDEIKKADREEYRKATAQ